MNFWGLKNKTDTEKESGENRSLLRSIKIKDVGKESGILLGRVDFPKRHCRSVHRSIFTLSITHLNDFEN